MWEREWVREGVGGRGSGWEREWGGEGVGEKKRTIKQWRQLTFTCTD